MRVSARAVSGTYSAFGLVLSSEFPLGLPVAGSAPIDLAIARAGNARGAGRPGWVTVSSEIGEAMVSPAGDRVLVAVTSSPTPGEVQSFLLGMVMLQVLSQRGLLSLHGGGVVGADGAIGFVAPSGAGKSTLIAALMRRGLPLIADDLLPLSAAGEELLAVPTYPSLRLWEDSLRVFDLDPAVGDPAPGYDGKRALTRLECLGCFSPEAAPLRRLYLLREPLEAGTRAPSAERLRAPHAFRLLAANRLGPQTEPPALRRNFFELLARVAAEVPCYALSAARSPAGLSAMIETVLDPRPTVA